MTFSSSMREKVSEEEKMKQFRTIFNFELKGYLKNKVFVGVTVFLILLMAAVMFFPRAKDAVFADNDASYEQPDGTGDWDAENGFWDDRDGFPVMLISAGSEEDTEGLLEAFKGTFYDYDVRLTSKSAEEIKDLIKSGEAECAFVLDSLTEYTYYVDNLSMYDMNTSVADEMLESFYLMNAMVENGMSAEEVGEIMSVYVSGNVESLGVDQMQNFLYTYIMVFALYMVILLYGQMVATNVATEKSSRAMEVLITSAKPTSMMFGKVLASCVAGFIQLALVFGSAFLFYNVNRSYFEGSFIVSSIFDIPVELLIYMLVFFILGFLIYAFLYGAVGSTVSKLEDINTSVMPITLLFIVGFMVVVFSMSSGSVDNMLMKVCSFVPFTSPMAMFTRIAMGSVHVYEIAISICILAASVVAVGVIAAKIYRVGVLLYGKAPRLSAIFKAIRQA